MPAARSDRRTRRGAAGQGAQDSTFLDAPAALSPREEQKVIDETQEGEQPSQHGISILKEIFPELDEKEKAATAKHRPLQQLLGSLPSPARATLGGSSAQASNAGSMPFAPPAHAPMPMVAPVAPPPPPSMPAPACQAPQEQCEPPRAAALMLPEQAFPSYRERLRAGGRGAFQRAYDAGFIPKGMKQEWNSGQTAHGVLPQQSDVHNGSSMPYGDSQQMWNGAGQMQSNDYSSTPMQPQYPCMQQVQQPQMMVPMLPQMAVQQPMQMPQGDHSPMSQVQMPQMQNQALQLPQMAMSQVHTPTASGASTPTGWLTSGQSTPTEIDMAVRAECMAILQMPQSSQFFPVDQEMLAAQLKASADSQRYED